MCSISMLSMWATLYFTGLLCEALSIVGRDAISPRGVAKRGTRLYSTMTFDASGVRMYRGESVEQFETEGSSLVATRPFDSGDIICEIPFSMCILAHVSGAIRGGSMMGQQDMIWEAAGDLRESVSEEDYLKGRTWDVQLALALLDATCGDGLAGDFWESYAGVYPRVDTLTMPFCLPTEILEMFQETEIIERALAQQKRLENLFPTLQDPKLHRLTAQWPHMTPIQYAFAMVRSRCFRLGGLDWFAIVPIIEIANHNAQGRSNARFEAQNVNVDEAGVPSGSCILRAKTAIEEGSAIDISYDEGEINPYSNKRLMTQYGFSLPTNLEIEGDGGDGVYIAWAEDDYAVSERLSVSPVVFDDVINSLVDATITFKLDDGGILNAYTNMETVACAELGNLLRRICNTDSNETLDKYTKNDVLQVLLERVELAESKLPTSFEDDMALLRSIENSSSTDDPFRAVKKAIITYRLNKKAPYAVASALIRLAVVESIN